MCFIYAWKNERYNNLVTCMNIQGMQNKHLLLAFLRAKIYSKSGHKL